uniref:Uncharacterized protein n=1 Tax=Rhizophora mucronata TaxID=61149 RepID=A0A2P2PDU6_RHIMU
MQCMFQNYIIHYVILLLRNLAGIFIVCNFYRLSKC